MMVSGDVYSDANALPSGRMEGKRSVMARFGARFGSAAFVTGGLDLVSGREAFLDLAKQAGRPIKVIYGTKTPLKSRAEVEALAHLSTAISAVVPRGKLSLHEEFPNLVYDQLESLSHGTNTRGVPEW
jgi:hypothetical protein